MITPAALFASLTFTLAQPAYVAPHLTPPTVRTQVAAVGPLISRLPRGVSYVLVATAKPEFKLPPPWPRIRVEKAVAYAAAATGIRLPLLHALVANESGFNSNARSKTNAFGVMQLEPSVAGDCGIKNRLDVFRTIYCGAKLLARHLHRYHGNEVLALAAYNAGPGWVDHYKGVPPFVETQNYVKRIVAMAGPRPVAAPKFILQ